MKNPARISACLYMKIAIVLFASALHAQTASGTLTIGKDQFEVKYSAAAQVKDGTRIVLADKPIPADIIDEESQIWDLKSQGFHGLEINITPDKSNFSLFVIAPTLQGSFTRSGTLDPARLTTFTNTRVEGSFQDTADAAGTPLAYNVKFAANVAPAEPPPTAADQTAAATRESTKAYLALVAAIRSGDKQQIMELAPPDRRPMIDTPDFPKMLKLVQAMTPTDIRVLKATETGDRAKLLASGSMDGTAQRGKIYLNRVNGKWVMASESWANE